jgi:anaerobic carbon-monoxide dehydrogenase iron sulfur subunit
MAKKTKRGYRLSGPVESKEAPIRGLIDVNLMLCSGCRLCEQACSVFHEGRIWPEASRIAVYQFDPGPLDIPVLCHQCWDFPCIEACPEEPKVIRVDEKTGAVTIDQKRCVGAKKCGACARACHHQSAIRFHPRTKKAINCDLCGGEPECARICPTGALSYLPGASFNGAHYAQPPDQIAKSLGFQFYPAEASEKNLTKED